MHSKISADDSPRIKQIKSYVAEGTALHQQSKWDEAIQKYHSALELAFVTKINFHTLLQIFFYLRESINQKENTPSKEIDIDDEEEDDEELTTVFYELQQANPKAELHALFVASLLVEKAQKISRDLNIGYKDSKKALMFFSQAEKLVSLAPLYLFIKGMAHCVNTDTKLAIKYFDQCIDKLTANNNLPSGDKTTLANCYYRRGEIFIHFQKFSAAEQNFIEAINVDLATGGNIFPPHGREEILKTINSASNLQKAQFIRTAEKYTFEKCLFYAQRYRRQKKFREAILYYDYSIAFEMTLSDLYSSRATLLFEFDPEKAIESLTIALWLVQTGLAKTPVRESLSELYLKRAYYLNCTGQLQKAKSDFNQAIKAISDVKEKENLHKKYVEELIEIAASFETKNNYQAALNCYQMALQEEKSDVLAEKIKALDIKLHPIEVVKKKRIHKKKPKVPLSEAKEEIPSAPTPPLPDPAIAAKQKEKKKKKKNAQKAKKQAEKKLAEEKEPLIKVPAAAAVCLKKLIESSHKHSYIVGGMIRDAFLNIKTDKLDIDIVTEATPETIKQLFAENNIAQNPYDENHFHLTINDCKIDIQCSKELRKENPLLSDARKRDFYCNTLYLDAKGKLYDPTGKGLSHIREAKLHPIYSPTKSLKKNPIRILRALYFAAKLGFTLTNETLIAIKNAAPFILSNANLGKINSWLFKLFLQKNVDQIFNYLVELGVLKSLFPKMAEKLIQQRDSILNLFLIEAKQDKPSLNRIYDQIITLADLSPNSAEWDDLLRFNYSPGSRLPSMQSHSIWKKDSKVEKPEQQAPIASAGLSS